MRSMANSDIQHKHYGKTRNLRKTQNLRTIRKKDSIRTIMEKTDKLTIEEKVIKMLKTVYDPEIPVDIYELGMIYKIDVDDDFNVNIDMTLTAPNCPAADFIMEDVHQKVTSIDEVGQVNVNLVFEPEWDKSMMSEEAKLDLGFM